MRRNTSVNDLAVESLPPLAETAGGTDSFEALYRRTFPRPLFPHSASAAIMKP